MNPHQIAALPADGLSRKLCLSLSQNNIALSLDVFTQLESRFQRSITTVEGSRKFLQDFLGLSGSPEVRALHIGDPLTRCVARLEYLLEMAGERARTHTERATLQQVAAARERGFDLLRILAEAPETGLTASDLAERLKISKSNLSPLIRTFAAHGIIDRTQQGKHAFLKLSPEGRALLTPSDSPVFAQRSEVTPSVSKPSDPPVPAEAAIPIQLHTPAELAELLEEFQRLNERIGHRAYELFQKRGFVHGHEWEDWLNAESEVLNPVPVEVLCTEQGLCIHANVAGFGPAALKLILEPRRLIIKGEHQGRPRPIFRLISFETDVVPEGATARLKDGVLELRAPKTAEQSKISLRAA